MTAQEHLTPHNRATALVKSMKALAKVGWTEQLNSTIQDVFVLSHALACASAMAGNELMQAADVAEPEALGELLMLKHQIDYSTAQSSLALHTLRCIRNAESKGIGMSELLPDLVADAGFEQEAHAFFVQFCSSHDQLHKVDQLNRLLENEQTSEGEE